MKKIHEFILDNGLKLFVKPDHRAPVVTFQVWYKVGSSYETDGITGISHFLEHMMFRGSKNENMNTVIDQLPLYGGMQNAFTSHDYTSYHAILPLDRLAYYAKFEADRMQHLLLSTKHFSNEKQIIMEERRMMVENNPYERANESFMALAYLTSPYRHPIIGWMEDIQHLSIQQLKRWYQQWYAPNNALVVVVGDVQPDSIYHLVKRLFGAIPASKLPALAYQPVSLPLGARMIDLRLPAKLPGLFIGFHVPVLVTAQNPTDVFALLILGELLAGDRHSRLKDQLVLKDEVALEVSCRYSPFDRLDNLFILKATPSTEVNINKTQQSILSAITKIKSELVTENELKRVKACIIAGRTYEEDSIDYQANEIGCFEAVGLSINDINRALEHIESITRQQVQHVAETYLVEENAIIARLHPLPISDTDIDTNAGGEIDEQIQ